MKFLLCGDEKSPFLNAVKKKADDRGIETEITQKYKDNMYYVADWETFDTTQFLPYEYNVEYPIPSVTEAITNILLRCSNLRGKTVLIIGRGNSTCKLPKLLLRYDATVIVAHSRTENITELLLVADIVINASPLELRYIRDKDLIIDIPIRKDDTEPYSNGRAYVGGKVIARECTDIIVERMNDIQECGENEEKE